MIHEPWIEKLDAYLDGELGAQEAAEVDQHLRGCAECAAESLRRVQLKRAIHVAGRRYAADPAFRRRIEQKVSGSSRRTVFPRWPAFAWGGMALLLIAAAVGWQMYSRQITHEQIVSEVVDLHIAALAGSSPVDVVSTDRHTVKPWFEGKIPFTFNLPELQGTPFELVGGRISYLEQSPGAELIFRIRKHQISVFIFQQRGLGRRFVRSGAMDARSFHLESFQLGELQYLVIGDAQPGDLKALAELLKAAK